MRMRAAALVDTSRPVIMQRHSAALPTTAGGSLPRSPSGENDASALDPITVTYMRVADRPRA